MKESADRPADDTLHAYVDGQLDPAAEAEVLRALQQHPDLAVRVLQWQAQSQQLRRLARGLVLGDTPAALTDVVRRAAAPAGRRPMWQAAAAVVLLVAGAMAGHWWTRGADEAAGPRLAASPPFVRDAQHAHAVYVPERRHPVEVTAEDEAHLVQWLSRRLGRPLKLPTLADEGWRLLGGRLLPGEGSPRAQFMYENPQGTRATLYVAVFGPGEAPEGTAFRRAPVEGEETFYWVDGAFGYALSAAVSPGELMAMAHRVHQQLVN